jgi:Flp pilus assembly protein TadB
LANSVYKINKGINKPIEFKGLKAQYIWFLAIGLLLLLILFAILYVIGINVFVCLVLILGLGAVLFVWVYRFSNKYGQYGLLKKAAKKKVPDCIYSNSRKMFKGLKSVK